RGALPGDVRGADHAGVGEPLREAGVEAPGDGVLGEVDTEGTDLDGGPVATGCGDDTEVEVAEPLVPGRDVEDGLARAQPQRQPGRAVVEPGRVDDVARVEPEGVGGAGEGLVVGRLVAAQ